MTVMLNVITFSITVIIYIIDLIFRLYVLALIL